MSFISSVVNPDMLLPQTQRTQRTHDLTSLDTAVSDLDAMVLLLMLTMWLSSVMYLSQSLLVACWSIQARDRSITLLRIEL